MINIHNNKIMHLSYYDIPLYTCLHTSNMASIIKSIFLNYYFYIKLSYFIRVKKPLSIIVRYSPNFQNYGVGDS